MSISFLDRHDPALLPGVYTVTVKQDVKAGGESDPIQVPPRTFEVAGPRYRLMPEDIATVFPPADSTGDHAGDLPHVTLTRSTLPWERSGGTGATGSTALPWLAILLLTEDEMKRVGFPLSATQNDIDKADPGKASVQVLEAPDAAFLAGLLPAKDDAGHLCHVRKSDEGKESAVVLGIRLPVAGQMNYAFLVSVENCYQAGVFKAQYVVLGKPRLVVLKAWRFAVGDAAHSIEGKLNALDAGLIGAAGAPLGYTLLPYRMRLGSVTAAYYHGPLSAGAVVVSEPPSTDPHALSTLRSPDHLVRYRKGDGVFDVSYAAAWELGRLLALSSGSVAKSLIRWKHENKTNLLANQAGFDYIDFTKNRDVSHQIPPDVVDFMAKLKTLELIPVNYLLPEADWVPKESIRFFQVDAYWMKCMVEGAFGIGRVLPSDAGQEAGLHAAIGAETFPQSGFLLRSDVVSSCPGLVVEDGNGNPAATRLLAPGLKLCWFPDVVTDVIIHPAPEELHCHIGTGPVVDELQKAAGAADFAQRWTVAFTRYPFRLGNS